jgi:endonuclease YncB( thermonuclease family)
MERRRPGDRRLIISDPNRSVSRLPRTLARLGRTPFERAALLVVGAVVAFVLGRWTASDDSRLASDRVTSMPATASGTPLVLDGDTIDLSGLRVRLFGIDAFERDQLCERSDGSRFACGQLARESLLVAIGSAPVTCTRRDVDTYGRMVAVCRGRDGDLSARVVEDGFALAYRQYSNDYVDEEDKARQARRGAWEGRFEAPWDYRHNGQGKRVR